MEVTAPHLANYLYSGFVSTFSDVERERLCQVYPWARLDFAEGEVDVHTSFRARLTDGRTLLCLFPEALGDHVLIVDTPTELLKQTLIPLVSIERIIYS